MTKDEHLKAIRETVDAAISDRSLTNEELTDVLEETEALCRAQLDAMADEEAGRDDEGADWPPTADGFSE